MTGPRERRGPPAAAGVDVGGTFTDVVVVGGGSGDGPGGGAGGSGGGAGGPGGGAGGPGSGAGRPGGARRRAVKVPTTPGDQGEGVAHGLDAAGAGGAGVELVAHGSTTATNAVLERAVARTVLVTTRGFADVLVIARQDRPALYDLRAVRPDPLVAGDDVVTVEERTGPDGAPVVALDDDEIARVVDAVAARSPESVAVSLLFSYAGPAHEERLCAALERLGVPVTRSSALLPEFREYERASTCVLNAAVAPVMRGYLSRLAARLPEARITVMTSGGGTAGLDAVAAAPVHTLLSGPAAGVVAAGAVAAAAGFPDAVAFDMGGTSTDVCLVRSGRPEVATDAEIGGLPFRTPAVAIHTVGAGGGSIASVDAGGALQVGPRSAGARPGPACYGHGGTEPTVTDAHCVLGHFGAGRQLGAGGASDAAGGGDAGGIRLDRAAAEAAVGDLPGGAAGILTVVRATMARALRRVTTERGVDPAALALVAYGGAGPLHAVALARELGCAAAVIPPAPGVLSALGLLLAPPRHEASRTVMAPADDDLAGVWGELEREAEAELAAQGAGGPITLARLADARYAGQAHELRVDGTGDLAAALHAAHEQAYGYALPGEPVTVVTVRVVATAPPVLDAPPTDWDQGEARPDRTRRVGIGEDRVDARVLDRASLSPGDTVTGPALIEQPDTTTLLAPGDTARVDDAHNLVVVLSP